jgi:hypothetical protein
MIEKYLTNVNNNFDKNIIDHENFNLNKDIYNLYNNTIEEPLHKFWFIIDTAKYINNYYDHSILKFAINDKNIKIKKTLDFIKYISENIKNKYVDFLIKNNIIINNLNNIVTIELPFKLNDNYPCILNLYNKELCIYTNDNNKDDITNIKQNINYLILFEINYFKIIKIKNNTETLFNLKFNFNIVKIQIQQSININELSLNFTINKKIEQNIFPSPPPIIQIKNKENSFELMNEIKNFKFNNSDNDNINYNKNNNKIMLSISEEEIQKKKETLKPIIIKNKEKEINNFDINQALIDQKILLKKVEIIKKKKKEKKRKNIEISNEELEIELEKALN